MRINFTPEQEAELKKVAANSGTDSEQLVRDAALALIDQDRKSARRYRKVLRKLTEANSSKRQR